MIHIWPKRLFIVNAFAVTLWSFLGCQSAITKNTGKSSGSNEHAVSLITHDLAALAEIFSSATFILVLAVFVLLGLVPLFIYRVADRWRLRHRLSAPAVKATYLFFSVFLFGIAAMLFFRYLFVRVPVVATIVAAAAAAGVTLVLFRHFPAWASGFLLVVQRRVCEGDLLHIGQIQGVVDHIGALRISLANADGAKVYLSIADLGRQTIIVSSPSKDRLVEYTYRLPDTETAKQIARARVIAALCPYRIAKGTVQVDVTKESPDVLRIRFQTWSEEASERASNYLKRVLETNRSETTK